MADTTTTSDDRTTTFAHDNADRQYQVTTPDPDGGGSQAAQVTTEGTFKSESASGTVSLSGVHQTFFGCYPDDGTVGQACSASPPCGTVSSYAMGAAMPVKRGAAGASGAHSHGG